MNDLLIEEVVEELRPLLVGRTWGKVFQLTRASLAVDLRAGDGRYLLLSVEPSAPRVHLIARAVRELEKGSQSPSPFALVLRKALVGATLMGLTKDAGDRVVHFTFTTHDAAGREQHPSLVAQLTGRSSNLFLLDDESRVVEALKPARGVGQEAGELYQPPARTGAAAALESREGNARGESEIPRGKFGSLSESLDDYYKRLERERAFDAHAAALSSRLKQETDKRRKLLRNLEQDLARHGDAGEHRRAGDLLLANISNAVREGARVRLTDYYAEGAPTVELEIEEGKTLQEEAARRFSLYSKARRAAEEIARRMKEVEEELAALEAKRATLARIVAARDDAALEAFEGVRRKSSTGREGERAVAKKKAAEGLGRTHRYRSSDGYEILVGRTARDNEQLTFRVARSHDLWLHAADYPGSHVVVRKEKRDMPVPHRTIIEAAQLAAKFSQARKDAKVAVHYTERKFVSKIKGAAPGLVRLASFRTIMVEPGDELERL